VYDAAGHRVRTLYQGSQAAGTRTIAWDGRDESGRRSANGSYFAALEAGGQRLTRTFVLVK